MAHVNNPGAAAVERSAERACTHGFSYNVPCRDCEIVWHQEGLENARRAVARHEAALQRLATARELGRGGE